MRSPRKHCERWGTLTRMSAQRSVLRRTILFALVAVPTATVLAQADGSSVEDGQPTARHSAVGESFDGLWMVELEALPSTLVYSDELALATGKIANIYRISGKNRDFALFQKDYLLGIIHNRRDIRSKKILVISQPHNQRAAATRADKLGRLLA